MGSFTAAGTAYATWGSPGSPSTSSTRCSASSGVSDFIWAFGDQRGRGFLLGATRGSNHFVAVTDFMKLVPDQVARWVPGYFTPLGTGRYGRSDTRPTLRRHFETDAGHVTVAVLDALAAAGERKPEEVLQAITRCGVDAEAMDPRLG